jgi:hypothetical protein
MCSHEEYCMRDLRARLWKLAVNHRLIEDGIDPSVHAACITHTPLTHVHHRNEAEQINPMGSPRNDGHYVENKKDKAVRLDAIAAHERIKQASRMVMKANLYDETLEKEVRKRKAAIGTYVTEMHDAEKRRAAGARGAKHILYTEAVERLGDVRMGHSDHDMVPR